MMGDWGKEHARALNEIQLMWPACPVLHEHSRPRFQADAILNMRLRRHCDGLEEIEASSRAIRADWRNAPGSRRTCWKKRTDSGRQSVDQLRGNEKEILAQDWTLDGKKTLVVAENLCRGPGVRSKEVPLEAIDRPRTDLPAFARKWVDRAMTGHIDPETESLKFQRRRFGRRFIFHAEDKQIGCRFSGPRIGRFLYHFLPSTAARLCRNGGTVALMVDLRTRFKCRYFFDPQARARSSFGSRSSAGDGLRCCQRRGVCANSNR